MISVVLRFSCFFASSWWRSSRLDLLKTKGMLQYHRIHSTIFPHKKLEFSWKILNCALCIMLRKPDPDFHTTYKYHFWRENSILLQMTLTKIIQYSIKKKWLDKSPFSKNRAKRAMIFVKLVYFYFLSLIYENCIIIICITRFARFA